MFFKLFGVRLFITLENLHFEGDEMETAEVIDRNSWVGITVKI